MAPTIESFIEENLIVFATLWYLNYENCNIIIIDIMSKGMTKKTYMSHICFNWYIFNKHCSLTEYLLQGDNKNRRNNNIILIENTFLNFSHNNLRHNMLHDTIVNNPDYHGLDSSIHISTIFLFEFL